MPPEFKPGLDCKFHSELIVFFLQVVKESKSCFSSFSVEIWNSQHETEITVNATLQLKLRPGLIKSIKKPCKVDKRLMTTQPGNDSQIDFLVK